MATLKNVTIDDTGFLRLPVGTSATRPAETSGNIASMRVNSDSGKLESWNGVAWELSSLLFPFRSIITNAYIQGGYKSSAAWNNINKTNAATDTTVNLGDGSIEAAFNYQWGACSKDYAYVFGAGGGHAVSSNYTIAYNMRTETQATDISRSLALSRHNFGGVFQEHYRTFMAGGADGRIEEYNMTTKQLQGTIGATTYSGSQWGMSTENYGIFYTGNNGNQLTFATKALSRHNFGGVFQEHYRTFMAGGADGRIEEYNMTTKQLQGTIGATTYSGSQWGMSTENYGIFYTGNNGNALTFATKTISTRGGTGVSNHHQQKAVNSKYGFAWAGNEGSYSGGNNLRKTNWTTNSTSGTVSKPVGSCGEENYTMGNDHQYMLGQYNGLQNNLSWRFNYATESGFQGGSSMEPKGKAGSSSAVCAWRD